MSTIILAYEEGHNFIHFRQIEIQSDTMAKVLSDKNFCKPKMDNPLLPEYRMKHLSKNVLSLNHKKWDKPQVFQLRA